MLPLRAMESSGRGGMLPGAACVKEEAGAAGTDRVVKKEALVDEEVEVKRDSPCEDGAGAASETAEPAGADSDLDVKDEIELGPVRVQARDAAYALRVAAVKQEGGQEPRDDCLRLLTGEKLHPCDICGKYFLNTAFLHRHQQEHAGPEPVSGMPAQLNTLPGVNRVHAIKNSHSCETCKKQFSRKYHLVVHRRIHTQEKPYSCDVCLKGFTQKTQLNNHKRLHHGHMPCSCEICKKRFPYLNDSRKHTQVHTGEKPYSCQICNKTFKYSAALITHKRIHTGKKRVRIGKKPFGEKPYICEVCKKQFAASKNLRIHMRIHTGEKPYSCEICDKKFSQAGSLKAHKWTHTGPFSCEICNMKFGYSGSLTVHRRTHTGENPYSCEICKKNFPNSGNLIKHRRTH